MKTRAKRPRAPAAAKPARAAGLNIAGVGRVCTWQGGTLWIGRQAGHSLPHAHHGIQISLALGGTPGRLLLRSSPGSQWSEFQGAIVMPNRRHEFDGLGGSVAQIFVEPETTQGRTLVSRYVEADIAALPPETVAAAAELLGSRYNAGADDHALIAGGQFVVDSLAGALPVRRMENPRIAAAIDFISRQVKSAISLRDVAAAVHLSPSRLRHLFVQAFNRSSRARMGTGRPSLIRPPSSWRRFFASATSAGLLRSRPA